ATVGGGSSGGSAGGAAGVGGAGGGGRKGGGGKDERDDEGNDSAREDDDEEEGEEEEGEEEEEEDQCDSGISMSESPFVAPHESQSPSHEHPCFVLPPPLTPPHKCSGSTRSSLLLCLNRVFPLLLKPCHLQYSRSISCVPQLCPHQTLPPYLRKTFPLHLPPHLPRMPALTLPFCQEKNHNMMSWFPDLTHSSRTSRAGSRTSRAGSQAWRTSSRAGSRASGANQR
ncbi:hypothetical protein GBAR_LOCUS29983, partial [Geodia barretti]